MHVIGVLSQVARHLSLLTALRNKLRVRRRRMRTRGGARGAEEEEGVYYDNNMLVVAREIISTRN